MNAWTRVIRRLLAQPAFLGAVLLLGASAISLNAAVSFLKLHFKKLPCELRVASLKDGLPAKIGGWIQVSQDQPIDAEMEQVLGTSRYVFRDYVDSSIFSEGEINALKSATPQEYAAMRLRLQSQHPEGFITAAVTYYTGLVDTVAHIPERCYVADGYEVSNSQERSADLHGPDGWHRNVTYSFLSFDDQTGTHRVSRNVGYLFHVDGEYDDSSFGVRARLQDLRERYGYYAKVELMTQSPASQAQDPALRERSAKAMERFLAVALPEVEKCLPDWKSLHR